MCVAACAAGRTHAGCSLALLALALPLADDDYMGLALGLRVHGPALPATIRTLSLILYLNFCLFVCILGLL